MLKDKVNNEFEKSWLTSPTLPIDFIVARFQTNLLLGVHFNLCNEKK